MLLRCTDTPRPELLIVASAPVNHEHALPLLIVIMLSAPLKPDHEFRIIVNPCIVTISAPLLPVFKSNRSCHILPSIVGPGRRYFVSCPCILLRRPGLAPCLASPGSFPAACLNRNARAHVLPKSSALGAALVLIVSCLVLDRPRSWVLALDTALVFLCPPASWHRAPLPLASSPLVASPACLLFLSCRLQPPVSVGFLDLLL